MLQQGKDIQAAKLNIAEQGIRLIANIFSVSLKQYKSSYKQKTQSVLVK
jgi:hypothetical protein